MKQLSTQKPVRFRNSDDKKVYLVVSVNSLINECDILGMNEIGTPKTVSQSELENVEHYEIKNSAEDTAFLDVYLTEEEAKLIQTISDGLAYNAPTYAPTLEITKYK